MHGRRPLSETERLAEELGYEEGGQAALEPIDSEINDEQVSLPAYEILTYPTDYTLSVMVDKWNKHQLVIPKFQRRFVWTQAQASKLIESFLLGLPVPPIFLYSGTGTSELLVVDGQQRLKSIANFYEGLFGDEVNGNRPVFRLIGLDEGSRFLGKTYQDLIGSDSDTAIRLDDSVLRAFVVKQLNPGDDTSIYHIFERLNTGGTFLNPQEVRNCVRHGKFNEALVEMNLDPDWRQIFGNPQPDKRLRDVELMLRFFALYYDSQSYRKPMKDFLNKFMDAHRNPDDSQLHEYRNLFTRTAAAVASGLGPRPFHIRSGLNAAVFDSVFCAFARNLENIPEDVQQRFNRLLKNPSYSNEVRSGTTDEDVVRERLELASSSLFA